MSSQFMRRKTNRKYRYEDSDEALVGLLGESDQEDTTQEDINLPVKKRPQLDFIEHKVQEGDTLSSLSLQYNCSISQIKQYNNIHRDNEIFALRVVRIPVVPFSIVTERVPESQSDALDGGNLLSINKHKFVNPPEGCLVDTNPDQQQPNLDSGSDISVCNPLLTLLPPPVIPSLRVDLTDDVSTAEIQTHNDIAPSFYNCNGADCGITWLMLFVCTLAVGFVGPLIYVFLLYEEKTHHDDSALSS